MPEAIPAHVSRETFERLVAFESLLKRWSKRINLISHNEMASLWTRHIIDSLRLTSLLPTVGSIADLGSGAGFPGLILSIATGRDVILVEADQRKAAFLREAGRVVEAPVTIVPERIEASGLAGLAIVTARALAPLPRLLELAAPIVATDGVCLFPKGVTAESELTAARREWQMDVSRHIGSVADLGCILEVKHLRRIASAAS